MRLTDEDIDTIAKRLLRYGADTEIAGANIESLSLTRIAAIHLESAFSNKLTMPNRTWLVTFGFIPLGPDIKEEVGSRYPRSNSFTFGVSVFEHGSRKQALDGPSQRLLTSLSINDTVFPIISTRTLFTPHAAPAVDATSEKGSCACWIRYAGAAPDPWSYGLFTARHVVDHLSIRDLVTLNPGGWSYTGTVADYGACSVDAAVIEIKASDWPSGLSRVSRPGPYPKVLAPGSQLGLTGRMTASRATGKIVSHNSLPGYWGSMMGQRLVMDFCGANGDSGGWVDLSSRDGVGIYMGTIDDGAGGKHGLAQDLHQACVYLEADIYQ